MRRSLVTTAAVVAALALGLTACSSTTGTPTGGGSGSSKKTVSIDVGLSSPIKVTGPPVIALFTSTDRNDYSVNGHAAATAAAKKAGVQLDYFGSDTPDEQLKQIQNAIQTKKYNAFAVEARGPQLCDELKTVAPAAGIIVATGSDALCAGNPATAADAYQKGTLTFIGGTQLSDAFKNMTQHAIDENSGTQNLVSVGGFPALTFSVAAATGTADALKSDSDIKNNGVINTDYSTGDALTKAQTYLLANPKTTIMISLASSITVGLVKAVDQAGLTGKVKIYDSGCNTAVIALIKAGTVAGCAPTYPGAQHAGMVNAIVKAFKGEKVATSYENDDAGDQPSWVNKANASSFTPGF
jgi:ABC-type sugar transport system substrate-binding protein